MIRYDAATIILFVVCMLPTVVDASGIDLTFRPPRSAPVAVNFQATLPTLRCGMQGRPSNECVLDGMLQARAPAETNLSVRYTCTINYSYSGNEKTPFKLSFSREERTSDPDHPITPGVGPPEKDKTATNVPDYGRPPAKTETIRLKGIAHHHGTMQIKDGRGEYNLAEIGPLILKEYAGTVMLETFDCRQE